MIKILWMFECKENTHNEQSLEKDGKYNALLIGYIGKTRKSPYQHNISCNICKKILVIIYGWEMWESIRNVSGAAARTGKKMKNRRRNI